MKNNANALIYTAEKSLSDAGDKVSADMKKAVQDKIEELKKTKRGKRHRNYKENNRGAFQVIAVNRRSYA